MDATVKIKIKPVIHRVVSDSEYLWYDYNKRVSDTVYVCLMFA